MFETTEVEDVGKEPWAGLPVVVDFDEIAYKAAAANETRSVRAREGSSFSPWQEYNNRTELYSLVGKENKDNYVIEDVQRPFALEKAFHKVDEMVQEALTKCKSDTLIGYLGSGSPRDLAASVEVYKGQRADMIRPKQLKEVRQYCIDKWDAIEVDGTKYEADDMLAIEAKNGNIQYTSDKDALQVEGWLLKPIWDKPRWMDRIGYVDVDRSGKTNKMVGEGLAVLVCQMITSDTADNYHSNKLSSKRFGLIGAVKKLAGCKTEKDYWTVAAEHFKWLYPEPVTFSHAYTNEEITYNWADFFNEYYCLAKMKESLDEEPNGYAVLEKWGLYE